MFGDARARLLIVGLAPGLQGANATGRPFTGDWAGDLLYETLLDFGFAKGVYGERADDGLELIDARIVNAVRCVPPQNKPTPAEISTCRPFLEAAMAQMDRLKIVVALGRVAHDSAVRAMGAKPSKVPFSHGGEAELAGVRLISSYHCSRYNTNTGVLTTPMFRSIFARAKTLLAETA